MIKIHYVKHRIVILMLLLLFINYKSKQVKSNNENNETVIEFTIKNKFKRPNFNKLLTYFWQRTKMS